ncbi:MAG: hypothetical protein ACK4SM_07660, partial [Aquificaceae bacterium]
MDPDILILAIVNLAEGVRKLIGENGAKAVLRDAGRQSGPKLFESLIGEFPEKLTKAEAIKRACAILKEFGFAKRIEIIEGKVQVEEDIFTNVIKGNNLTESP